MFSADIVLLDKKGAHDMRKLEIVNSRKNHVLIRREILRSEESRYDHRLHGVLMVSRGMSCGKVADWLGQDTTSVERWVKRFNADGCDALREGEHTGRRRRLTTGQWDEIRRALRRNPREFGYSQDLWDGKLLSHHLAMSYGITIGVRQCQRMFHEMDLRLRKPRPVIANADPEAQAAYKKTAPHEER
jgi:transposase